MSRGEWVGLGEGWQAPSDSFVAVVACGYSDGYPAFINDEQANCHVRCKGSTYDIIGQVCSNHILIHLGGSSPNVTIKARGAFASAYVSNLKNNYRILYFTRENK